MEGVIVLFHLAGSDSQSVFDQHTILSMKFCAEFSWRFGSK